MRTAFVPAGTVTSVPAKPVSVWPTATVWPNGNFSMGLTRAVPPGERFYEDEGEGLPDWFLLPDPGQGEAQPLILSNASISRTSAKRRAKGLSGITTLGQQMVRNGAYVLERDYGRDDLVMATLTLPTLPKEARVRLHSQWGVLTNRLVEYLTRRLEAAARPAAIVGCVEVQTARLQRYEEGYLHLHVVYPAHSNAPGRRWVVESDEIRAWWKSAIERFAEVSLSCYPRVETAIVRKSAEKYLGKYLSKGGGAIEEFIESEGEESCPSQWWFMSKPLKDVIKAETLSGEQVGVLVESLICGALEGCDLSPFEWVRHVDAPVGDKLMTVGWVGRLTGDTRRDLVVLMSGLMA